ncbi:MAG TPA: response regulator [Thermoanaerobaculia bacterium]|jgi:CheY-like chemotaxis protein|nr:response regulator [Thermoanaerobaculia bacterium]
MDSVSSSSPKVLIVDDCEVSRIIARREIRILGFSTVEATSGAEALEIFARTACDAVLMDCQMPGLDGYETTRRLRLQESEGRRAVVIALTGDEAGDAERCRQAGMDAVMPKSRIGVGELAEMLSKAGLCRTGSETLAALARHGRRNGDDLLGTVVATFLEQGPRWLAEICKALTTGDVGSLALAAHDLAGAASILGVGLLGQQCIEVEVLARRGEIDTVGERLPSLMAAWERAETELRALHSLAAPVLARTVSSAPLLPV